MKIRNHQLNKTAFDLQLENILQHYPKTSFGNLKIAFQRLFTLRRISENILVLLLQYMGLMLHSLSTYPFLFSPASGTACAFIFLRGYSIMPGIWLGSFFACFLSLSHHLIFCLALATLHTLQAFLLLILCYRFITPTLIFYQLSMFLRFIFLTNAITFCFSCVLCFFYKILFNIILSTSALIYFWLSNLNGILIIAIALATWDAFFEKIVSKLSLRVALLLLCLFLLILSSLKFFAFVFIYYLTLSLLFTIFISINYGWLGAVAFILLFNSVINLIALMGYHELANYLTFPVIINLQVFLCLEILTGLSIAVIKSGRQNTLSLN